MCVIQIPYIAHGGTIYRFEKRPIPSVCDVDETGSTFQLAPGAKVAFIEMSISETWDTEAWIAIFADAQKVLENMRDGGELNVGSEPSGDEISIIKQKANLN